MFSPANATSVIGLTLTIIGSFHLTTLAGVLTLGVGRFIDIFDGPIARRTHTSPLGALVDATCDKIGIAVLVPAAWITHIAPYWLLIYILVQNVLNVVFSALTSARGGTPAASRYGKHALFAQNISLGFYALGSVTDIRTLDITGLIIGLASIYWAARATYGYFLATPEKTKKK